MLGNEANLSEVHKQAFGGEREQIRSYQVQRNETGLLARSIASGGRRWLLWRILFQLRRCSDSPEQQSLPLLKNDTCSGGGGAEFGGGHPLQGHADVRGVDPISGRSDLGLLWTSVSGSVRYEGECAVCKIPFSAKCGHAPG